MSGGLRFTVLGPVRAWRLDDELVLGSPQQRAVLALLLIRAGQPVHPTEIVDVLWWGETPPASAPNAVHRHTGALRRLLEPGLPARAPGYRLTRSASGYRLNLEPDSVDLHRFRRLTELARGAARGTTGPAGTTGSASPAGPASPVGPDRVAALRLYGEALELRQGTVATGAPVGVLGHPLFVGVEREYLAVLKEAADTVREAAMPEGLLARLREAAALHPLDEQLQARLLLALGATGRQAEALDTYQRVRDQLAEGLGIDPGAELREAHRRVLRQETPSAPGPAPGGAAASTASVVRPGSAPAPAPAPVTGPGAPAPTGPTAPVATSTAPTAAPPAASTAGPPSAAPHAVPPPRPAPEDAPDPTPDPAPDPASEDAPEDAPTTAPSTSSATPPSGAEEPVTSAGPIQVCRPAQLPADLPMFTGRSTELAQVLALLPLDQTPPDSAVVTAISGMAGAGKTTLAVRAAHRMTHRFPDGQLYVNLRGFEPSGNTLSPSEALRGFLEALGVASERVPVEQEDRAALYRTLLADRRVLVLLDNARDSQQVRPLLPGSPGCMTIVTSRNSLSGLVATDGATPLTLSGLQAEEAREALRRRLSPRRVDAEPEAVDELIERCGRLPLALAIVAAYAAVHPAFPLAAIAEELREAPGLEGLSSPDPLTDARAVFSWSYRTLGPDAARLFRLLALRPGQHIGIRACASLAGLPTLSVRPILAELAEAHLLSETSPGRYTSHDLLFAYATELLEEVDSEADQRAAFERLLDYYLHSTYTCCVALRPSRDRITLPAPLRGVRPESRKDYRDALAWCTNEHRALVTILNEAVRRGLDRPAWQLAWSMELYLDRSHRWHEWGAVQQVALDAATRLGDLELQARAHRSLGSAYYQIDSDRALHHITQAREMFHELGSEIDEGHSCTTLAVITSHQGRVHEAVRHHQRALALYSAANHPLGRAMSLNNIGNEHTTLGNYEQAIALCRQALALFTSLDEAYGVASTLESLGRAYHHLGDQREAATCFERALRMFRELEDRYNEADVLAKLGDTHLASDRPDEAVSAWQHALRIFLDLSHPRAEELRGRLRAQRSPVCPS